MTGTRDSTASPSARRTVAESVRETLESIVVAFTLAFIFRAFIVEAFIIPTGSMASTLYGEQVTHTCSTCGFEYAHGADIRPQGNRLPDTTLRCPNCASTTDKIAPSDLRQPSSGDRILVHKWPFNIGGSHLNPRRWDPTVFKDPHNGIIAFIKRLVGLPGEVLEIIDGDIYTASLAELREKAPEVIAEMEQLRADLYRQANGEQTMRLEDAASRYAAINEKLLPYLSIQRKAVNAPAAQDSLWFNVYNHDFLPNYDHQRSHPDTRVGWSALLFSIDDSLPLRSAHGDLSTPLLNAFEQHGAALSGQATLREDRAGERWEIVDGQNSYLLIHEDERLGVYDAAAAKAWHTDTRELVFSDVDRTEPLAIHFQGKRIDDFYAYNYLHNVSLSSQTRVPVGDLRLRFVWFPDEGDGTLSLHVSRDEDLFVAEIAMDGTIQIRLVNPQRARGRQQLIGPIKLDPFPHGQAVEVEFMNVDFRVSLGINGEEVLATTEEQYSPDLKRLLSRAGNPESRNPSSVAIAARRLKCRLRHVVLERDVYYLSSRFEEDRPPDPPPGQPPVKYGTVKANPFVRWPGWGTEGWPIMLKDEPYGEYFMLGDNSPCSKDSRLWWEIGPHLKHLGADYRVGTVPEDQLIGRAFFVYWPSGYRRTWTANIGIIPNFGRMRWIR